MSKTLVNVPTTVAELRDALPDLSAQIFDEGVRSVDQAGQVAAAVKAEQERIILLIGAGSPEEATAKIRAAITSGMTAEALAALGVTLLAPAAGDAALQKELSDLRAQNLELLKRTGADNPGAGGENAGATAAGKDYMTLVTEYRAANGGTMTEAMQAVTGKYPEKHREYIKKANETRRAV